MKATICLIPYKNDNNFFRILDGVLDAEGEFKIMVVDNNLDQHLRSKLALYSLKYIYNGNLRSLAGATNRAIEATDTEYFVYLCTNHIYIYSADWLTCMVKWMDGAPKVAMAGDTQPFEKRKHVQGGIYIARTEILKNIPYDTRKHTFSFMDVYISDEIQKRGHLIGNIPCVRSVMMGYKKKHHLDNIKNKRFKIAHSHQYHA